MKITVAECVSELTWVKAMMFSEDGSEMRRLR